MAVPGQGGSGQGVGGVSAVGFTHTGDAHPEADIVSLSLRMRDVITCFWCGLLDEDQVSALSDAGGWVALQDRYVHRACRLLVIL